MSLNRIGLPAAEPVCADGWTADPLVPSSVLLGANGLRWGPDGHLYVAQTWGNQISRVDAELNVEVISAASGPIVSPDDIAFDSRGNLYVTELMTGRVSSRDPSGATRVLAPHVPGANGITVHQDQLFVSEFRAGGRLLELYPDGRRPREIASGLAWPNALSMGHDGKIYFPLVEAGEIWRASPVDGTLERFATGLSVATAVKFGPDGKLVALSAGDGAIHRYDIDTGEHDVLARVNPGIDNLEFSEDGEVLVSSFVTGTINVVGEHGAVRTLIEGAMIGPFDLASAAGDSLIVADGNSLVVVSPSGELHTPLVTVTAAVPVPWIRGVAVVGDGSLIFTSPSGVVSRYLEDGSLETVATGLDQPMGVAVTSEGEILVCEHDAGRVLGLHNGQVRVVASDLGRPAGVCISADGTVLVTDRRGGRLLAISGAATDVVASGLGTAEGVAVSGELAFVLDRQGGRLLAVDPRGRTVHPVLTGLASDRDLPGTRTVPPGLDHVAPMHGPVGPFCGVAATSDGAVHVACEADGSIWRVRPLPTKEMS